MNSVKNQSHKLDVQNAFTSIHYTEEMSVSVNDISCIIDNLTTGKSPGLDGLTAEHLQYASSK